MMHRTFAFKDHHGALRYVEHLICNGFHFEVTPYTGFVEVKVFTSLRGLELRDYPQEGGLA